MIHATLPDAAALDRRRKAAIIVQCLLADGSRPPIGGLPEDTQVELTRQLAQLRLVDRATLDSVVTEFADALESVGLAAPSGLDAAVTALSGHLSPAAAARLKAESSGVASGDPWGSLTALDTDVLVTLLGRESVEVSAVALSKLPVAKAAEVLGLLPGERARRISYAVSRTAAIAPHAVRRIGDALAAEYCTATPTAFGQSASQRLGAILNSSRESTREELLGGLEAEDVGFAAEVRRAIFTFRHIPERLRPTDIPKVLRGVETRTLATGFVTARAAGGADAATVEFILSGLPQRMGDQIREEMEALGGVRPRDGEAAQTALVNAIREAAVAGDVVLIDPDAEAG